MSLSPTKAKDYEVKPKNSIIKRPIEDIQKSCRRMLQLIDESAPAGTTVMLCPSNLSFVSCPAAIAIENTEYGVKEAPIMPLPNCIAPDQCFCTYSVRNMPDSH